MVLFLTKNDAITKTVSYTTAIYHAILTVEKVGTTVNYCSIVYNIGHGGRFLKTFFEYIYSHFL